MNSTRKIVLNAIVSLVICVLFGMTNCGAQSRFETTPYRVRIVLATDGSAVWTEKTLDDLKTNLSDGITSGFGKLMNVEFDLDSQAALRQHDLSLLKKTLADSIVELSAGNQNPLLEKIIYLQLQDHFGRFRICAVEHDLQFKYIGSPAELSCPTMQHVAQNLFRVFAGAFGGNARLTGIDDGIMKLRARASLIPARDPLLAVCAEGSVLQLLPIGQQEVAGVNKEIEVDATTDKAVWRYLVVQKADPLSTECKLMTRFNEDANEISGGQFVARQIHPIHNRTVIQFSNRDDHAPLAGLDIEFLDRLGSSLQRSKSDAHGRLVVSKPGGRVQAGRNPESRLDSQLVELVVRCHNQELLRFPVVAGWQRQIDCPITLGPQRLAGLAAIETHRAELNDWIAHREIVMARATVDESASAELLKDLRAEAEIKRSGLESKIRADASQFMTDSHLWKQLLEDVGIELTLN